MGVIDAENSSSAAATLIAALRASITDLTHTSMGDKVSSSCRKVTLPAASSNRSDIIAPAYPAASRCVPKVIEAIPAAWSIKQWSVAAARYPSDQQLKNLKVYAGPEHPHAAQQPEPLDIAALSSKNSRNS